VCQVCDIAAIVSIAHAAGALVCVDNSFLTPLYQRPLELGADISMTSGTKYIGGHGDTTLGMLAVRDPELGQQLYFLQNSEGAGLAPMDCWLALRGLKTVRGGCWGCGARGREGANQQGEPGFIMLVLLYRCCELRLTNQQMAEKQSRNWSSAVLQLTGCFVTLQMGE